MRAMMSKSLRELLQDPKTARIIQKAIVENRDPAERLQEAVTKVYPTKEKIASK